MGILDSLLPELTALKGVEIREGKGHKDNFLHTLQVVKQTAAITDNIWLRLASILHDIGKAPTKRFIEGAWTFQNHELVGSKMIDDIFERFNLDKSKLDYVKKIVEYHGIAKELTKDMVGDSAIRRFTKEMGPYIDDIINFCKCDVTTANRLKKEQYKNDMDTLRKRIHEIKEKDEESKWRPPIDGNFIMKEFGVSGRKLGQMKSDMEIAIKSGKIKDDFDDAYSYLLSIKDKY
jgi:putative nucleotidyltransferase with HDIG domain